MPAANRSGGRERRRLTTAGLIAISAATLLMTAWAVFPSPAFASAESTPWTGNGSQNLPCTGGTTLWILAGFGDSADDVSNVVLHVNGGTFTMTPQGNNFKADVPGPGTSADSTTAFATWTWNGEGAAPTAVLTISHCEGGTTTTTTTTTPTTTTTTPTTTTTTPTTTTTTPTTTTTTPTTTTTTPTTTTTTTPTTTTGSPTVSPTSTTTTTGSPTVSPTTFTSTTRTSTPVVAPTTVRPGGTAFTGVGNVVPLGAIALMLMTGGSGLLWLGSRRRRNEDDGDE
jgi:hypothetical protein